MLIAGSSQFDCSSSLARVLQKLCATQPNQLIGRTMENPCYNWPNYECFCKTQPHLPSRWNKLCCTITAFVAILLGGERQRNGQDECDLDPENEEEYLALRKKRIMSFKTELTPREKELLLLADDYGYWSRKMCPKEYR